MVRAVPGTGLAPPVKLAAAGLALLLTAAVLACGADSPDPTPEPAPSPSSTAPPEEQNVLAGPDPLSLPAAAAPQSLGSARLPEDADSILDLFKRLPGELAGRKRTAKDTIRQDRLTAGYEQLPEDGCSSVRLQALDLSASDFFPTDWTADRLVAFWTLGADWEVEDAGRDGDLFWVRWNSTCSSAPSPQTYPFSSLIWGTAGSNWVFCATATDSDGVAELVAAFKAAAP